MIRNGKKKAISCALVAAMSVGLAACGTTSYDFKVSYDGIKTGDVSSKVSVHDPSILKADGEYYIFGSHMSAAKSSDLLNLSLIHISLKSSSIVSHSSSSS